MRHYFPDGRWGGDACGCLDDRCKDGFHHDPDERCGCLTVWLDMYADAVQGRHAAVTEVP